MKLFNSKICNFFDTCHGFAFGQNDNFQESSAQKYTYD